MLSKLISVCTHLTDEMGSNLSADWERESMMREGAADVIGKRQKEQNEERERRQLQGTKDGKRTIQFDSGKKEKRRDRDRDRSRSPPRRKHV